VSATYGAPILNRQTLADAYALALSTYLARPEERGLNGAYELGRQALQDGFGPLDLVAMHQAALEPALRRPPSLERTAETAATSFLLEALSPFEMTYRRFLEANAALRGINEALESETRRTARQIHDGAGQILFTLQLALAELGASLPGEWKPRLDRVLHLADHLDHQLRSLSRDLYPVALDDLGLNYAVRHLLDGVSTRAGLKVVFRSSAPDQLPSDLAVCLYRAVHEAVANVVRHARATTLEVAFEWNDRGIVCKVGDDGVGLPDRHVAKTGLGILGIRERVKGLRGELVLTSAPGQGTHLVISIPVHRGEPCHGDTSPDR
jgi:signal transduction histidine kinase